MKAIKNLFLWIENKFWNVVIPLMSNSTLVHRFVVMGFRADKSYKKLNILYKVSIMVVGGWLVGFLIGSLFLGKVF